MFKFDVSSFGSGGCHLLHGEGQGRPVWTAALKQPQPLGTGSAQPQSCLATSDRLSSAILATGLSGTAGLAQTLLATASA